VSIYKKESNTPDPYSLTSFSQAALFWFEFGFNVIPLVPNEKR
jgi:hypothetical protein